MVSCVPSPDVRAKQKKKKKKKVDSELGAHTTGFDSGCCCGEVAICSVECCETKTRVLKHKDSNSSALS